MRRDHSWKIRVDQRQMVKQDGILEIWTMAAIGSILKREKLIAMGVGMIMEDMKCRK